MAEKTRLVGMEDSLKRHFALSWAAVAGFALALFGPEDASFAEANSLLVPDFWKTATVEDVATAIADGADIHARTEKGYTPLHFAAGHNENPAVPDLLIDRGADIHARNLFGTTPLHSAAGSNDNPDVAGLLLDRGANVNARDTLFGDTPLHRAAKVNRNPDVAGLLLDRGADIHARDASFGATPLHLAVWWNQNPDMAGQLLDRGADAKSRNESGLTPLDYAEENKHIKNSEVYRRLKDLQNQ